MFLLYYVWGFFIFLVSVFRSTIEKIFFAKNNPFLMTKRTFKFLSYFERIFLVLFYRKGWFERSLAYLYRKKDIEEYRRKHYPLINLFHLYLDKSEYKFEDLKLLSKQYEYFFRSISFSYKLRRIFRACFSIDVNNFIKFLILQEIFFKKYFNTYGSFFFKKYNTLNTLTLNYILHVFLLKANSKLIVYDLDNWHDWYNFTFSKKVKKKIDKLNFNKNKYEDKKTLLKKKIRLLKIAYRISQYKIRYMVFSRLLGKKFVNLLFFRHSSANIFKIKVIKYFDILLKNYYTIKFSESSITKYINSNNLKNYSFFYLRKNRIFNKGRYSRNRQLYRTGVYWCLWLNIIMVYGLYFIFYRFSFNFGYIWWGILILAYSTIFSRIVKYNFYNPFYVYKEFLALQRWYGYIFKVSLYNFENYMKKHFLIINIYNYIYKYQNSKLSIIFNKYYYYTTKLFFYWLKKKENMKIVYLWQGMKEIDKSFLRYKTVLHWIKEIYRMFTTW